MMIVMIFILGLLTLIAALSGKSMIAEQNTPGSRFTPDFAEPVSNILLVCSICLFVVSALLVVLWKVYGQHPVTHADVFFWGGFSLRDSKDIGAKISDAKSVIKLFKIQGAKENGYYSDRSELMESLLVRRIRNGPSLRKALKRRKTNTDDVSDTAALILLGCSEEDMLGASHAELRKLYDGGLRSDQIRTFYDHGIDSDFGPSIVSLAR